jgi:hypothetical protein
MASPPIPPLLGHLAARPFSFYPPILHIEHNEWIFRKATWSELVVINHKTGAELSIPRHFVGEVSLIDHPVVIVGLNRELEYKDGAVWPYQRRVIEMPLAVGCAAPRRPAPAPVVAIRLESRRDRRAFKWIGGTMAAAIVLHFAVVNLLLHVSEVRHRAVLTRDRQYLDLTARDDYSSVVRKLGPPAWDHRESDPDGSYYRALAYPARKFTVILMGRDPWATLYIGTMDANWNPIHSAGLSTGGSTANLLRALKQF